MAWYSDGLPDFILARKPAEQLQGVPVFCYHLVEPEHFEADLAFLRRNGYVTLAANELLEYLTRTAEVPPRSVVLSFDDGPQNFYEVAFPLLQKYQARAVAFIAPGLHADTEEGANDNDARPLSWREIELIAETGLVDFQSHTYESRFVPRWPMPAPLSGCRPEIEAARRRAPVSLEQDLIDARVAIESRLAGRSVEHLAFPMYLGTDEATRIAAAVGYRACYWGPLPNRPLNCAGDSPLTIARISDEFVRRLPGEGRQSLLSVTRSRVHRAQAARAWRRRYAS